MYCFGGVLRLFIHFVICVTVSVFFRFCWFGKFGSNKMSDSDISKVAFSAGTSTDVSLDLIVGSAVKTTCVEPENLSPLRMLF